MRRSWVRTVTALFYYPAVLFLGRPPVLVTKGKGGTEKVIRLLAVLGKLAESLYLQVVSCSQEALWEKGREEEKKHIIT